MNANLLRNPKVTSRVALLVLTYFIAEWVVSATWRGYYAYSEYPVGPLGVAFCGPQGNWPCSALYPAMNVALVVTGLAVAFVAAGFIAQKLTDRGHAILLLVAGVALASTGVITQKYSYAWNFTMMTVFITLGSVAALLIAISSTSALTVERRGLAVVAGAVSLVGVYTYLGGHQILGAGGAQRVAVYGILIAVIALGTVGLRTPAKAAEPEVEADTELVEESR